MSKEYKLTIKRTEKKSIMDLFNKFTQIGIRIDLEEALLKGEIVKDALRDISSSEIPSIFNERYDKLYFTLVLSEDNPLFNQEDFEVAIIVFNKSIEIEIEDFLIRDGLNETFKSLLLVLERFFKLSPAIFSSDDSILLKGQYNTSFINKISMEVSTKP